MKILLASSIFDLKSAGGVGVVVNELAQTLADLGHEITIMTTWNGSQIVKNQIDWAKIYKIPSNNLYWIMDKNNKPDWEKAIWQVLDIWNPITYFQVKKILFEIAPDVFHSHKLRGLSPSIWSAARAVGVRRIIHTAHDFELLSPHGLFMGKIGKLARNQHFVMKPYQAIRRQSSSNVDVFTTPSEYTMSIHRNMGFFGGARKEVVLNSHGLNSCDIEKNKILFSGSRKKNNKIKLLFIGRLEFEKGIDLLCEAISKIDPEGKNIELSVAGWGGLEDQLKNKYCGIHAIQFLGAVYGERKKEVFAKHHVLVAPSIVPETFGIVISEALAYGIPVIASNLGAYPELVSDGKTGILFTPGSIEALIDAISKLTMNPKLISKMSENCFSEASKYSLNRFVENYLSLYR